MVGWESISPVFAQFCAFPSGFISHPYAVLRFHDVMSNHYCIVFMIGGVCHDIICGGKMTQEFRYHSWWENDSRILVSSADRIYTEFLLRYHRYMPTYSCLPVFLEWSHLQVHMCILQAYLFFWIWDLKFEC